MWKNYENHHKNHAVVTFVQKSWIRFPSFLVYIFTLGDAVFHGLSPGIIKFLGNLHFSIEKVKILWKNMKKSYILSLKNHRIDSFFP